MIQDKVLADFPIDTIRAQFPSLAVTDNGRPRVYVDNPAGTQVPKHVTNAVSEFFVRSNGNLGGYFQTSQDAEKVMHEAYGGLATFLGAASEREIVIGQSMTGLTYMFSRSLGRQFGPGDEVIVTRMDHDGNIAPWLAMAEERGTTVRWLPFDRESWRIEPSALESLLSKRTRILALNYASNLTGSINDVGKLTARAHEAGALVYVDAVQFAPHRLIDVYALGCDFLACSAYKFYGPHVGVLWGREDLLSDIYAYKVRPLPDTLPERFEVGTPQLELIAAAAGTVRYFEWLAGLPQAISQRDRIIGAYDKLSVWERRITKRLIAGLVQLPGVTIRGLAKNGDLDFRVPTVSFTHAARSSASIARELSQRNIFVWSGHNFALEIARSLGLNEEDGVVRIGLAHYNTEEEVDTVLAALSEIL